MKNILRDSISRDELISILKNSPPMPLLPPLGDAAWKTVAGKPAVQPWLKKLHDMAQREIGESLPVLTGEMYADFAATGVRIRFERPYFERRRMLARAAIAVLTAEDPGEKLKQSLLTKIQEIFHESSWALPAHVTGKTGQDPMCIDLFSAETANLFAELLNLFSGVLPAGLTSEIRGRLCSQFFENYLNYNGWWVTGGNNWNAVCHQGVIGAALGVEENVELLSDMLLRMKTSLPHFLKGFGNDGGTTEGPGYWGYGFGWFAELNEQLEKRTRGALSIFEGDAHVAAAARFGPVGLLEGSHLLNFSDCPAHGTLRAALVQYLADRLDDATLRQTAAVCWVGKASEMNDLNNQRADLFCLSRMLLRCPTDLAPATLPIQDVYLPDTQWLLTRSRDQRGRVWEFAAKAGHNAEHHNHNDVGSYLLNVDGQRVVIEIGSPEYVRDFFSEKRYTFLAARSLGHSVPLVNGQEQPAGGEYRGVVLKQNFSATHTDLSVDLTAAYPAEAKIKKLVRAFCFNKQNGKLRVSDAYELQDSNGRIETAIIVEAQPQRESDGVALKVGGRTYFIEPRADAILADVQKHEYHAHDGSQAAVYRVVFAPADPVAAGALTYEISPM